MEGIEAQEISALIGVGMFIMLSMAVALVAFYGRAQRKLLSQRLEAQEMVLHKTILAQEEERSRIAKDLHDDIGSKLNVIHLHLQRFINGKVSENEHQTSFKEMGSILNSTINTTRKISHELLPPTLQNFGLAEALHELCDGYSNTGQVTFDLQLEDMGSHVQDKMKELNVFRVLQELTKNSTLHGEAKLIRIRFSREEGVSYFYYIDDGKGFDKKQQEKRKGLGMNNIESRLKMAGGSWTYETSPGNGLRAEIALN